jgi:hypothetical protein
LFGSGGSDGGGRAGVEEEEQPVQSVRTRMRLVAEAN